MNATANPIVELRSELRSAASRRISSTRRRRRLIVLAVIIVAGAATSLSIAANGWLTGQPAPPPVVQDFREYTPQLGFHPDPTKAVLVAQDGDVALYATTNREGTYCLVLDTPWERQPVGDGGTCVPKEQARHAITAGLLGGKLGTYVVAGRVADPDARKIRFTAPDGERVEREIGSTGFYVATVHLGGPPCPDRNWEPTFSAIGSEGHVLAESQILLLLTKPAQHLCEFGVSPHG